MSIPTTRPRSASNYSNNMMYKKPKNRKRQFETALQEWHTQTYTPVEIEPDLKSNEVCRNIERELDARSIFAVQRDAEKAAARSYKGTQRSEESTWTLLGWEFILLRSNWVFLKTEDDIFAQERGTFYHHLSNGDIEVFEDIPLFTDSFAGAMGRIRYDPWETIKMLKAQPNQSGKSGAEWEPLLTAVKLL